MIARSVLAAALLVGGLPASAEPATPTPLPAPATQGIVDPAAETLALEQERHSRFTLPVLVEGNGPFAFLIDTGSEATAITHEIRDLAKLSPAGTATLIGMASRRQVELANVRRITFGTNSYTNFAAPVLERANVGADGIIGLDALQDYRVLIDFRKATISVEDTATKEGRGFEIVVRAKNRLGQLLITDAEVEGVRTAVIIDTGAQASLGNLALRERIRARRAQSVVTTDVNGVDIIGELAVVNRLSIEGLSLRDVPLTFADAPAFEALGLNDQPVLSIGMQHLALFDRVAIDFDRKRIAFDVPADVAAAMREAQRGGVSRARF
ncbi:retroviral-like aspartic protease family protein [Erythrobacter sp. CCH5-A1]|jgi:predicted aspartyl protease|uniref:retroviral-like aspartic protease family protein n=1 Tax=Erythrobacter sp. CCH5-A1 TaxID=1768792 RepID=UPI00082BFF9A|nr:retroviral-like aspartic protease family protein [Erythrobacter sp. CCH5-A1]